MIEYCFNFFLIATLQSNTDKVTQNFIKIKLYGLNHYHSLNKICKPSTSLTLSMREMYCDTTLCIHFHMNYESIQYPLVKLISNQNFSGLVIKTFSQPIFDSSNYLAFIKNEYDKAYVDNLPNFDVNAVGLHYFYDQIGSNKQFVYYLQILIGNTNKDHLYLTITLTWVHIKYIKQINDETELYEKDTTVIFNKFHFDDITINLIYNEITLVNQKSMFGLTSTAEEQNISFYHDYNGEQTMIKTHMKIKANRQTHMFIDPTSSFEFYFETHLQCSSHYDKDCLYLCDGIDLEFEYCDNGTRKCINGEDDTKNCKKVLAACTINTCRNEGECEIKSEVAICICKNGYSSQYCQNFHCDNKCNLHGDCVGANTCACKYQYGGDQCNKVQIEFVSYNELKCEQDGYCEGDDNDRICKCPSPLEGIVDYSKINCSKICLYSTCFYDNTANTIECFGPPLIQKLQTIIIIMVLLLLLIIICLILFIFRRSNIFKRKTDRMQIKEEEY